MTVSGATRGRHRLRAPGTEPVRESRRPPANVFIGREEAYWRAAEAGGQTRRCAARVDARWLERLGADFAPDTLVDKPVHRAASDGGRSPRRSRSTPRVIIMDEPTSSLTIFGDRTAAGGDCRPEGAWHLGDLHLSPAGRDHDLRRPRPGAARRAHGGGAGAATS